MKCINPLGITRLGTPVKRAGLLRPAFFVGCGKCIWCRVQKTNEWTARLMCEAATHKGRHYFITLTYSEEHILETHNWERTLIKSDLQKFWKRLRRINDTEKFMVEEGIKYFAVGEYGSTTYRPHYHAIGFGFIHSREIIELFVQKAWPYGFVDVGSVTHNSIRYVAKYVQDKYLSQDEGHWFYDTHEREFQLQSKGIGIDYLENNLYDLADKMYLQIEGYKVKLPRAYIKRLSKDPRLNGWVDRYHDRCIEAAEVHVESMTDDMFAAYMQKTMKEAEDMNAVLKARKKLSEQKKKEKRL